MTCSHRPCSCVVYMSSQPSFTRSAFAIPTTSHKSYHIKSTLHILNPTSNHITMPLSSFRNAIGHVENALYMMKDKRHDQSEDLAYGNNYQTYHNTAQIPSQSPPPPQNYGQPPYSPPGGWSQHWDNNTRRYYYIEQATGRSQWEPPVQQAHQPPRPTSSHRPYSVEQSRGNNYGEHNPQHLRPHSNSNPPQMSRNGSPLPRAMSIPPGYSLDTKTGQLVSTMLPPTGHHSAPVKYW